MDCPRCHKELGEGAAFCIYCGARAEGEVRAPEAAAAREPEAAPLKQAGSESAGAEAAREVEREGEGSREAWLSMTRRVEAEAEGEEEERTVVASADTLVGRVLDGKYELRGRLGVGGMGTVYRARRVHIGDEVAVKVLHPKYLTDDAAIGRFRREARAAAQLHHPNVITIHDYGETEDDGEQLAYIVMELVRGESLRDILRGEGRLQPARAVALMRDICAGVGSAHRRNIVHRDIKPDNIIVLAPDDDHERETVKVVDFGIAKLRDVATSEHTLTMAGVVVGTPFYMSPEQCLGETLDARADVYSLGALLYEMLAGSPPFNAPTATGVIAKHLTDPPPRVPSNIPVTPALAAVVERALSKEKEGRQADATEFGRELVAAEAGAFAPAPGARPAQVTPTPLPFGARTQTPAPAASRQNPPANPTGAYGPARTEYAPSARYERTRRQAAARPRRRARAPLVAGLVTFSILAAAGAGTYFYLNRNGAGPNAQANAAASQKPAQAPGQSNASRNSNAQASPFQRAEAKVLNDAALAQGDLAGLAPSELRLLFGTVYARHGRVFNAPEIAGYFQARAWYKPAAGYTDAALTDADRASLTLLRAAGGEVPLEPVPDPEKVRREVTDAVEGWADAVRRHDLDAHMAFYADTLETYYDAGGVARERVRADRQQEFDRYPSMSVTLTVNQLTLDDKGAQVIVEKTWRYQGATCTQGKAQQFLRLVRGADGRWRITGEKNSSGYPIQQGDCTG